MLYSFINMKLRDFYPSLDALCEDMNVEKEDIVRKLKLVGFEYNPAKEQILVNNVFCIKQLPLLVVVKRKLTGVVLLWNYGIRQNVFGRGSRTGKQYAAGTSGS
ncbi:DUF4250 domain-containing protein [Bacteroides uniformis]|nr:DUF4250 domain-containing protein [Bacteroides uniformis]